jgi:ribosome maturation factor RimP
MVGKERGKVADSGADGRGRGASRPSRGGARRAAPRHRPDPDLVSRLARVLAPVGFDLEDVSVTGAGGRSVVRVVVDRDGGIDLDAVAEATRLVSAELDADDGPVSGPYVLEVTSPGVDRPLVAPRHWRRARGRLVSVELTDGERFVGRLHTVGDETAALVPVPTGRSRATALAAPPRRVRFADVARAVVEIEFGPVPTLDEDGADVAADLDDFDDLGADGAADAVAGADAADDTDDGGHHSGEGDEGAEVQR